MARLGGLGKGLGALIPSEAGNIEGDAPRLVDLPIDSIIPNQHQPRVHFDEESLAELAASIREIGVLQPVLVRPIGDSAFELVAGERRWRAARRAGLAVIPAIVRNTNDLGLVERALVENLHRQDITPLEEVLGDETLSPRAATVLGPCRVIPQEHPLVSCRTLDLPGLDSSPIPPRPTSGGSARAPLPSLEARRDVREHARQSHADPAGAQDARALDRTARADRGL